MADSILQIKKKLEQYSQQDLEELFAYYHINHHDDKKADKIWLLAVLLNQHPHVPFVTDIEKDTIQNKAFRQVLFTSSKMQLVTMSLLPKEDIGIEVHPNVDQFFRVEEGHGKAILNGVSHSLTAGTALVVPAGVEHNIINTGKGSLKLYTIYSPPQHPTGTFQRTKPMSS